ncbi:HutD family protein [Achromobacter sp. ACRQX]|uniref:HutD/Ves family protein n=1 Tax=Achromobacter sp. ACRQX TaxID=2918181 RepID=UPI001EF2DABC|nr:HutD family protein [Achromobacter sp. ACRQX]MCG7326822.1 HutD family protein [Achromobacter sp. ACRQX]
MAQSPDPRGPVQASWLALPPEPWKNGGGVTRTLAADPAGRWRVSIADIERDGPYSRFPGYDRVSVVLAGEGVMLQGEGVAVPLRLREPAVFGGDALLQSTLVGGPVQVLNLFVLRGGARASVTCSGSASGCCEVGALPAGADGLEVTRVRVTAGAYEMTRGVEMPGVDTPGVDTPGVGTPGVANPGAPATQTDFTVILDITVQKSFPD